MSDYESGSGSEGEWEVVNTKTKKAQKAKQKQAEKQSAAVLQKQLDQDDQRRQREDRERFYAQYVAARGTADTQKGLFDASVFSQLAEMEEKNKQKEIKLEKKRSKVPAAFEGEEVIFVDNKQKGQKKSQHKKTPSVGSKATKPTESLAKTSAMLDNSTVKQLLNQYNEKYPGNYDVQLKSLAEYFESVYSNAAPTNEESEREQNFEKGIASPLCYVRQDVQDSVKGYMDKIPEDSLVVFFWFLLTTLLTISEQPTQIKGYGIRVLIQIIARYVL